MIYLKLRESTFEQAKELKSKYSTKPSSIADNSN